MVTTNNDAFYSSAPFQAHFKGSAQSLVMKADTPYFTILAVSDHYLGLTHKQRGELLNKPLFEAFPGSSSDPKEQFSVFSSFQRVIETGEKDELPVFKYEIPIAETGTRETYFWSNINEPILDEHGHVAYIINITANITEQFRQQQALKEALTQSTEELQASNQQLAAINEVLATTNKELTETQVALRQINENLTQSESRFRLLVQEAPVAIFVLKGRDMVFEIVNDRMYRMLGKSSDIIGKAYSEAVPELIGQPFFDLLDQVYDTGEAYYGNEIKGMVEIEGQLTVGYFNFIYQAIKDGNGKVTGIMCTAIDVVEQVNARKTVERAEESLRIATESGELGTWYYETATGRFVTSPRFRQFFGFPENEQPAYAEAISRILEEDRASVLDAVSISYHNGTAFKSEYRIVPEGNKIRWVRAAGKMVSDENGNRYLTGVIADISEQKNDDQRKNDFINIVSHELKTPLTSISGYVQILQHRAEKKEDTLAASLLQKAYKQVDKMTTMINGFLNVSRLESGKLQIDKTSFDIATLVKEIEEETLATVSSHFIMFAPIEPTLILADRNKIGHVINNLISNAIKYSLNGTIIQIACTTVEGIATLSVKDNGIGVQPEDIPKLFDRYYRVGGDSSISGFGIGLYLSSEIIKHHAGKIWLESKPGKGSTFYFSLPVIPVEHAE